MYPIVITELNITIKVRKCNSHFDYKSLQKVFIPLSVYKTHTLCHAAWHSIMSKRGRGLVPGSAEQAPPLLFHLVF